MSFMKIFESLGFVNDEYESENSSSAQKSVPTLGAEQPHNPFTEIQVLTAHTDIVRNLIAVNNSRLVSASDDATAIVWDFLSGQRLYVLVGHTRPITSMLFIPITGGIFTGVNALVTCSSDKCIRIWDLDLGKCLKTVTSDKMNSLKAVVEMADLKLICSAGQEIKLWSLSFEELCGCDRANEGDSINAVICMNKIFLISAVGSHLVVYKAHTINGSRWSLEMSNRLESHLETISCLTATKGPLFCSGSLDGSVIIWSTDTWSCTFRLYREKKFSQIVLEPCSFSIQHVLAINNKYLLVARGPGFAIYDSHTGNTLTSQECAHHSKVLHLQVVCSGSLIASCSEDGAIKLWGFCTTEFSDIFDPSGPRNFFVPITDVCEKLTSSPSKCTRPELVGECLGHGGIVYKVLPFTLGMCSCGADGSIVLWKDGEQQWRWRNKVVQEMGATV